MERSISNFNERITTLKDKMESLEHKIVKIENEKSYHGRIEKTGNTN